MKHLAKIQREFVKEATQWNDLSQEAQKQYLQEHPKSKRKMTAKPGQSGADVSELKDKTRQKKEELEKSSKPSGTDNSSIKVDENERMKTGQDYPEPGQLVKVNSESDGVNNQVCRFLGDDPNDSYANFMAADGSTFVIETEALYDAFKDVSDSEANDFKGTENKSPLKNVKPYYAQPGSLWRDRDDNIYKVLGHTEGSFGFGGGDAMLVMNANGEISNVDYDEDASINDPKDEDHKPITDDEKSKFEENAKGHIQKLFHGSRNQE
jgi:hypothetical protein